MAGVRRCRHCGCTEDRACIGGPFGTCYWVTADECSECVGGMAAKTKKYEDGAAKRKRLSARGRRPTGRGLRPHPDIEKLQASARRLERKLVNKPGRKGKRQ